MRRRMNYRLAFEREMVRTIRILNDFLENEVIKKNENDKETTTHDKLQDI